MRQPVSPSGDRAWVFRLDSSIATLTYLCCSLPFSPNPEHPDIVESALKCHSCNDTRISSAITSILAAITQSPIFRATASHSPKKLPHLAFSSTAPIATGIVILPIHTRLDTHLAVTRPSDARESCSAERWDARPRSHAGSHVGPVFRTAAGVFYDSHSDPGGNKTTALPGPVAFSKLLFRVGWTPV